jgi:hypothetical protein
MTFKEFLEDAGVVGGVVGGDSGGTGDDEREYEMRGIRPKYTAPDREVRLPKSKKRYAKFFQKET